tara:strand:- start:891 stop:2153 length:1263 start_codon:yes stop_codon:yes gene_type:complete
MATFKTISSADIKTTRSNLNQLIDFVEEDISGSNTRKKYQVFVTGTTRCTGVTSSLYHTVFDQNHQLQTANELFDMTIGLYHNSETVTGSSTGTDANGKLLFPSESLMMREKVNIYRQYAQLLLGNAESRFIAPFGGNNAADNIDEALFLNFKRLFVRDGIKRETFAMRFFQSASAANDKHGHPMDKMDRKNLFRGTPSGSVIFTDVGAASSVQRSNTGGDVGNLVNSSNTSQNVGLLFYQQGIAILDLKKITSGSQKMSGSIDAAGVATTVTNNSHILGKVDMGRLDGGHGTARSRFIPNFLVSGSIDDILEHIASVRFGSGSQTFLTFQNNTQINSTLVFCRATADEFNFSSNPTYTNSDGRIKVIDESEQGVQKSFSFVTTVGLYDANEQLLAVAKLSRPVEKNDEKDLTFRVRLDF